VSEQQKPVCAIHGVVAVVDGGKSDRVVRLCQEEGALFHLVSVCHGTARTEILDLLGLGESKKETVFCLVPAFRVGRLLTGLADRLHMRYPGKGMVFSVPLTSISGRAYQMTLNGQSPEEKEEPPMKETEEKNRYEVVVTVLNQGYTNLVMEAARQVGARGGTVLNARGIAKEEVERFLGISIQAEKEVVFMVVDSAARRDVMRAISECAGLKTPGKGIVFSLPVSQAIGLS
jgi:nitrogen regulatory protein PII